MAKNDPYLLACLRGLEIADEISGVYEPDDDYDVFWNCKGRKPKQLDWQEDEIRAYRRDLV